MSSLEGSASPPDTPLTFSCRVIEGMSVVEMIENCETGANDRPVRPVVIADCGEIVSSEDTTLAESKGDGETTEEQVESSN